MTDPAARVPSGTTIRFTTFVLAMLASTASVFSYLWQVAHPALQSQAAQCLSELTGGQINQLFQKSTGSTEAFHVALLLCLRPADGGMTWWAGGGVILLALGATADYLLTPWWLQRFGGPGHSPLVPFDRLKYPDHAQELDRLVALAGVERHNVTFYTSHATSTSATVFGTLRRPRVKLDLGLITLYRGEMRGTDRELFRDVVLHELGHVRNRDNRSTYLTVAAWRTFYMLIAVGYLVAVVLSGTTPVLPDAHTALVLGALIGLVFLSVRAVLRTREFQADATAAFCKRPQHLQVFALAHGDTAVATSAHRRLNAGALKVRAWASFHPEMAARRAVLADPRPLFRPSSSATAAAGTAVAVAVAAVNPAVFSALVTWRFGELGLLLATSGNSPLTAALLMFGPAALLTALPASALICAQAWRTHLLRQAYPQESRTALLAASAAFAAGLAFGSLLGFDDAVAGTWGLFESGVLRDVMLMLLSTLLLFIILTVLSLWAAECATAWSLRSTGHAARFVFASSAFIGAIGFTPMFFAWTASYGVPLSMQWVFGPSADQDRLIGTWPLVRLLFVHPEVLGLYDDVPGSAAAFGFACLFVVLGIRTRARTGSTEAEQTPAQRPPLFGALPEAVAIGLACGAVSIGVGVGLMLWLRSAVGGHTVTAATGASLEYLTRVLQAVTAVVAAIGATILTRRTHQARLSSGVLLSLLATAVIAPVAPQLLYIGFLGLHHKPVNTINDPILLGVFGHAAAAWAVVATVFSVIAAGFLPRREADTQPAATRPRPLLTRGIQIIAAVAVTLVFAELIQTAYYYYTLDF